MLRKRNLKCLFTLEQVVTGTRKKLQDDNAALNNTYLSFLETGTKTMAVCNTQISQQIEEEFLQCKVCFEVYRTPRTLSCLHSFCEPCLEQMLDKQKGTVTCPECRTVNDLQGCVRNAKASFFINSLLDLFHSKTTKQTACSLCPALGKSAVPASSRCLDCADFLCESCAQGHCLSKLTLGHRVVSLEDYVSGCYDEEARSKQERHCQSHQEPLRYYCSSCSISICRDCRMLEHFSHQVLSLAQATTARRSQLEELISSLDGNVRILSQHEQEVDSAIQQLKEAENVIKDQLSEHISVVMEQLFAQRDEVCNELSIFIEQQEQKYISIKKDLQGHINSAHDTKDFSTQVMQKGKDYEILDLEGTIQSQIERLQKVQIPDIEIKTPVLMIKEDLSIDISRSRLYKVPDDEDDDIVQVCNLRGSHNEYTITAYQNEYVIVSEGPSCSLSLYDPRGMLVDRVKPSYDGKFVFLAVNSREEFIICDTMKKCVIVLSRAGEIMNICSSADSFSFNPKSVCVDKWDNIYVVDGKRIMMLSPRGDFVERAAVRQRVLT
ncbi:hypothetical protein AAFF_G00405690 [Aldrovandia affinis]|uniref:RING-type E3 ubiquitin transferase n=1 Tax=Aldrovandia affinis TaxID=143900 RepID=A0AAD7WKX7_9TELE|nr:hypothetical protein AAFF_G00405690 [Aldrovandia affinis]